MKKLTAEHKLMSRQVAFFGADAPKLSETTGMATNYIYRVLNDPLFVKEVERLTAKTEEQELIKKKEALATLYANIGNIVNEQIKIGLDPETPVSVRSATNDKLMQYLLRKKDLEAGQKDKTKYLAVQLNEATKELAEDPDVMPNVVKFNKKETG